MQVQELCLSHWINDARSRKRHRINTKYLFLVIYQHRNEKFHTRTKWEQQANYRFLWFKFFVCFQIMQNEINIMWCRLFFLDNDSINNKSIRYVPKKLIWMSWKISMHLDIQIQTRVSFCLVQLSFWNLKYR